MKLSNNRNALLGGRGRGGAFLLGGARASDNSVMQGFQIKDTSKRKRIVDTDVPVPIDSGHIIKSIENSAIIPLKSETASSKLLVIPLLNNNRIEPVKTLDELAADELLADIKRTKGENTNKDSGLVIPVHCIDSVADQKKKAPLLLANIPSELLGLSNDDDRFRIDISLRADDMDVKSDRYKSVPIDQFGAAMLRGMGWSGPTEEDSQAAKTLSADIIPREQRLGLGATARPPEDPKRGNKAKKEEDMKAWAKKAMEKVARQQLQVNDLVWLSSADLAGRRAQVAAVRGVPGLDRIRVCLETDGRLVEVRKTEAVLLSELDLSNLPYSGSLQDYTTTTNNTSNNSQPLYTGIEDKDRSKEKNRHKDDKQNKDSKHKDREDKLRQDRHNKEDKHSSKERKHHDKSQDKSQDTKGKHSNQLDVPHSRQERWLRTGIRVRVVSKSASSSKASYLQKGSVLDVYGEGVASVRLDDGSVLDHLTQRHLETVLPPTGARCMVLVGEHTGMLALLLEKKKDSNEAVVQLEEDLAIAQLSMDHIAAIA